MATHLELGAAGETLTERYCRHLGWPILGRNVRLGKKEIDIICRDGETVVFIEVKTRRGQAFGRPEEAITEKKLRALDAAIALYLREQPTIVSIRLDVVAITYPGAGSGKPKLKHLRGVGGRAPLAVLD